MLVFFGFTSCPDICPAGLQLMAGALEKLGPKAQRITPIFISVDPQRDTPEKLAAYVKNFDPRLVGLTGTPEEIAAVAKAYKVYYAEGAEQRAARRLHDGPHVDHLRDGPEGRVRHALHAVDERRRDGRQARQDL